MGRGILFLTLLIAALQAAYGQAAFYLKEVIVPGVDPVSLQMVIGRYSPFSQNYVPFDTLTGDFSSDAIVDGDDLYICVGAFSGTTNIFKYNLNTYQKIDSVEVSGAYRLAMADDKLLVTCWYPATDGLMQIYDKNSLNLLKADSTVAGAASQPAILGQKLYVANGPYSGVDTTKLHVYSLVSNELEKVVLLDTFIKSVDNLYAADGFVYAFGNGYLTKYDIAEDTFATVMVSHGSACYADAGIGFGLSPNKIYYNTAQSGLKAYNTLTGIESPASSFSGCITRGKYDGLNGQFYLSETDFFSYGKVKIVSASGLVSSFEVGYGPEAIALRYASNFAPVATGDTIQTLEGEAVAIDVLQNDGDVDGDGLVLKNILMQASHGTATIVNNQIAYTPEEGFVGLDMLTYEMCDDAEVSLCDEAGVIIVVLPKTVNAVSEKAEEKWKVYPNPAHNDLYVRSLPENGMMLRLTDLIGREVNRQFVVGTHAQISLENLNKGVYLLRAEGRDVYLVEKIVKY